MRQATLIVRNITLRASHHPAGVQQAHPGARPLQAKPGLLLIKGAKAARAEQGSRWKGISPRSATNHFQRPPPQVYRFCARVIQFDKLAHSGLVVAGPGEHFIHADAHRREANGRVNIGEPTPQRPGQEGGQQRKTKVQNLADWHDNTASGVEWTRPASATGPYQRGNIRRGRVPARSWPHRYPE